MNSGRDCDNPRVAFEQLEQRMLLDGALGAEAVELFAASPVVFIENAGQWDSSVRYASLGDGGNVLHTTTGPVVQLFGAEGEGGAAVSVQFDGAAVVDPAGRDAAGGYYNFHIGDQADWRSGVGGYKTVAYDGLYDGVDLLTWGRPGGMKYEFNVAAGADPSQIQITYSGADALYVKKGDLHVATPLGELVDDAPIAWQVKPNGKRRNLKAKFELLDADTVAFKLRRNALPGLDVVIDPNLAWSTYLGGASSDGARAVATDSDDNVLVAGDSNGGSWVSGGFDTTIGGWKDTFVAKLTSAGQHLWSTFLGGDGGDYGHAVAVDGADNVLVAGETSADGWIAGGYDTTFGGAPHSDGYVAKLNSSGQHVWSTFLGGAHVDRACGVAVGAGDSVVAVGTTISDAWVAGGHDTARSGTDGFAVRLSSAGAHVWSTYMGGGDSESAYGVAVDGADRVVLAGITKSDGWTAGGYDTTHNGGLFDAFALKLNSNGTHSWSTHLGGDAYDFAYAVAVNSANAVVVVGTTRSVGWTAGGFDTTHNGGDDDGFVAQLTSGGAHTWSTYLGGAGTDEAEGVAVDASNRVLVTGRTTADGWVTGGFDVKPKGSSDAFLSSLTSAGGHSWSAYLGGKAYDSGRAVATVGTQSIYVVGSTSSSKWPVWGYDTTYNGGSDAFAAKISKGEGADLVGKIDAAKLPASVTPGHRKLGVFKKVQVLVMNQGTAAANGMMAIDLFASADKTLDEPGDTELASIVVKVKIKPGKLKKYKFKKVLCQALAAGDYYLLANIDADGNVAEHTEANNVGFTDRTVTWT